MKPIRVIVCAIILLAIMFLIFCVLPVVVFASVDALGDTLATAITGMTA